MAFMAMVFISAPWAFQSSHESWFAAGLQWWMLLQAQGFSTYAWVVELRRLALAVAFMTRFSPQIPFPSPILAPIGGWKRFAVRMAAGEVAWRDIRDP